METSTPSLAQQRAGQPPASLPLVNMSQAGHRCRLKSTLFNPGRNSSFSPNLCAYLCQPVLSGVGEGTQDSVKKSHRSQGIVSFSRWFTEQATQESEPWTRTPTGISNSVNWRLSEILHRPDVQVQAPSVERTRPGDNGMLLRCHGLPLDHPENWVGRARPGRGSRLPPAAPCFRPPPQTSLPHQVAQSLFTLLSPLRYLLFLANFSSQHSRPIHPWNQLKCRLPSQSIS